MNFMNWTLTLYAASMALLGCGEVGLANAPAVGGAQVEPGRLRDVIANGEESCERSVGGSPLRGHYPPCSPANAAIAQPGLPGLNAGKTGGSSPSSS
jgi:hypothetical protein